MPLRCIFVPFILHHIKVFQVGLNLVPLDRIYFTEQFDNSFVIFGLVYYLLGILLVFCILVLVKFSGTQAGAAKCTRAEHPGPLIDGPVATLAIRLSKAEPHWPVRPGARTRAGVHGRGRVLGRRPTGRRSGLTNERGKRSRGSGFSPWSS